MNTLEVRTQPALSRKSLLLPAAAVAAALGLSALLHAQEAPPNAADQLARQDRVGPYVAAALQGNPGLRAAEKRYQAARQSIDFAGALPNPMVQLTHFVESIQTRTGPQEQAISLQQPIPWLGKLGRKRDVERSQAEALWHAYSSLQFQVIDQVAAQALELAYLDKGIAITEQNIAFLKQLESIIEDKVRAGGKLSDLLRLQVEIERTLDNLERQKTAQAVARAQLSALLGGAGIPKLDTLDFKAPAPLAAPSDTWLAAVAERSPQIAVLRSLSASQEARVRLAKLSSRPDFSVGLNYIKTGQALSPSASDSGTDPWALMVGVSLPVWGKANNAVTLQAQLQQEAIGAQIEERTLTLRAEAASWIARLEDSEKRIQRYETKLLPLARQSKEITASGYQADQIDILDFIDSDRALLNLETEYWRAAANAWQARWKLATLSGGLWLN